MAGSKSDVPAKGFHVDSSAWDLDRFKNTAKYDKKVEAIFNQAVQEASLIASNLDVNPDKPFQFSDYPQTNARVNKLFSSFSRNYASTINLAVKEEWLNAAQKNDEFVKSILNTSKLTKEQTERYFQRNLEALHAFQQRKIDGTFTLSDRIWKLEGQFKSELEMGLDIGLGEGRSAQQLSQDIRQNLKDPDRLFRRVRDKHGNLQLSKHAKAFHPGRGVYRSSYKNAMRLTRSEANIAYLTSDHLRWQQLDFVVGFDVVTSNNHPQEDICDLLKGRYPKTFVFKGWHVQCRCHKVAVLASAEEFNKAEQLLLDGGDISDYPYSNKVESLPKNFTSWINDNQERIASAKSLPYFISDNISKIETIYQGKALMPDNMMINNNRAASSTNPEDSLFELNEQTIKELEQRGWYINDDDRRFNDVMRGFDVFELEDYINSISQKHGINITERRIESEVVYFSNGTSSNGIKLQVSGSLKKTVDGIRDDRFTLSRSFGKTTKAYDKSRLFKTVEHEYLKIPKSLQGLSGEASITKNLFKVLFDNYQKAGIEVANVHANINVGGYAWARYNFNMISQGNVSSYISSAIGKTDVKEAKDFLQNFKDAIENHSFKESGFNINQWANSPYAKDALLGSDWYGELDFTDDQALKGFLDYLYK